MKVPGKLTKTEGILLLLGVLFLAALAALYVHMSETAEGTDYTITTARQPEASGKISSTLLLGLALTESCAIYGFVTALIIKFTM